MVLLVAISIHQYAVIGWGKLTWLSIIVIPILGLICGVMSRRQECKRAEKKEV
jgi:hypothetical protein